ncbi:tripartite tricarboxylate transporter substrate binding protein [Ramlibacter henchirensis]|uniref:Tripartite tricarboxylate transporter substrate binding protein n=1 Tax=Ramlibacter henchirensis TaxID=204072 RepID=A0A4Z0C5U8_9BURK|nr:tripartite tricarboxylate transporter substrate binding protein [Ramlibacter henchirensis]TFZ05718.1 tripartite tricarboxylate transporter substrate binding protein [Ramlibacter henchirensis]
MKAIFRFLLLLTFAVGAAHAQFPNKPIRLILSTSPGGGADVTARLIAPKLSEGLGQNVVVENRPGASGMIAGEYVARQPADGYTILLDITTHAVNPALYPKMPYEPLKDLVPVTQVMQAPNVLVVHPSVPVNNVREFIAYAKGQTPPLAVASSGNGSAQHLAAEMFKMRTGLDLVHVPYKGGGPALADVVAGQVPVFFALLSSATPHIKAGRLKPLAVTGSTRAQSMPELPTIAEAGLSGYEIYDFNGLFLPARTPPEIVQRWQREVARVLAMPEIRERFAALGTEPVGSTPQAFEAFLRSEITKWTKVVKDANIKVE